MLSQIIRYITLRFLYGRVKELILKRREIMLKEIFNTLVDKVVTMIGKVKWKTKRVLLEEEKEIIKKLLEQDYYIILTRHAGFLSSYAISFSHLLLTGKMGYYAHCLMNVEDTVKNDNDYRFIEATRVGVHYSGFNEAIDDQTSAIALLRPKNMSLSRWTDVLDKARSYVGKEYDTLYDLANDNKLSCVELVRQALRGEPDYDTNFAEFEKMINKSKNLDPQMFYECSDFEIEYEVRH